MRLGEKRYHKASIMEKVFASADAVIPIEVLFDAMACIFVEDVSMKQGKISDLKGLNKNYRKGLKLSDNIW